ncbi:hypothetical protein [Ethanoligenens sp.]|uniref:hypothetical protein n=1 Tax=Ethanoligenens sp. TaxID=2099655 RepID=UPI0039ED6CFE
MKSARVYHLVGTAILSALLLAILMVNFSNFFPALKRNALSPSNRADTPINIPQNINFLNDDKQAFLNMCNALYGSKLPLSVDSNSFLYEGAVDGYHLYRMQANLIETEPARQYVVLGKYLFESDRLYRPSPTGLYLVKDNLVYTLEEAYTTQLVDFSNLYRLYKQKDPIGSTQSTVSSGNR